MELEHLELNESDDLSMLLTKMCLATNKKKELVKQYGAIGAELNSAEVAVVRAKTPQEKEDTKVKVIECKGHYKEIETIIDLYKDTINCLKIQIKAVPNY